MQQDLKYVGRGADKVAASNKAKTEAGICLCRMPLSTLKPALTSTFQPLMRTVRALPCGQPLDPNWSILRCCG